jgi:hypothetical protein
MRDPQILVNREAQQSLVAELAKAGHNGGALVEAAREALVASIHAGIGIAVAVAVFAIWQCRRVPRIKIGRAPEPAPMTE